jgi:hypothetical protein
MVLSRRIFPRRTVPTTTSEIFDNPSKAASPTVPEPDQIEVVRRILRALAGLEFGSVEIIVQNSKVVQIERTQRSRFTQPLDIPRS